MVKARTSGIPISYKDATLVWNWTKPFSQIRNLLAIDQSRMMLHSKKSWYQSKEGNKWAKCKKGDLPNSVRGLHAILAFSRWMKTSSGKTITAHFTGAILWVEGRQMIQSRHLPTWASINQRKELQKAAVIPERCARSTTARTGETTKEMTSP